MFRITETLQEFLSRGYELPSNLNDFLDFKLQYKDGENIVDIINLNVRELFIKRNLYKEIGSETEELFKHNLSVLIDEALIIYNPQLHLLNDNFDKLANRVVEENSSGETSRQNDNNYFYNPANTNGENLKIVNKDTNNSTSSYNETRQRSFGFFKSNPEIIDKAMQLKAVMYDILTYLDKAFIGEY